MAEELGDHLVHRVDTLDELTITIEKDTETEAKEVKKKTGVFRTKWHEYNSLGGAARNACTQNRQQAI